MGLDLNGRSSLDREDNHMLHHLLSFSPHPSLSDTGIGHIIYRASTSFPTQSGVGGIGWDDNMECIDIVKQTIITAHEAK